LVTHPTQISSESISVSNLKIEPRPVLDDISIVIPTLGRDILERGVYWILIGSAWPERLILVNQGDYEKVDRWVNYLNIMGVKVLHIHSHQRGRSAGINRGLEQVKTPFFAVTDDDCFVDENWLKNMVMKLRQNPNSIVTGRVEGAGEDVLMTVTSLTPAQYHKPRLKFDSMSGGNMGSSMTVVKEVGLFEEDPCMQTAEDAEWAYRSLRNKIKIIYAPEVCLWHFGWRDTTERFEQYKQYALSHGGFYGKYLRKGDGFILLRALLHFLRAFRWWIRGKIFQDKDLTAIGRAYVIYLLPGILRGWCSKTEPLCLELSI
jgi:glycosyltransferase involved in cell wall biosynthesis